MNESRTKNAFFSIISGLIQRIISIFVGLFSQWAFLQYIGLENVSLDGLFSGIFMYLSLAELGIGNVIIVRLYKSVAEENIDKTKSLLSFYKKSYRVIGTVIFVTGLCILPILPKLVNFEDNLKINLYLIYVLFLVNTCLPYMFFSYKASIINANQKTYIINKYGIISETLISLSKFIIILITENYAISLMAEIIIRTIYNYTLAMKAEKLFPFLKNKDVKPLENKEKKDLIEDVKKAFIISLSNKVFIASGDIITSLVVGTIFIGRTYMYNKIIAHINTIIIMLTTSFEGSVGNLVCLENKNKQYDVFNELSLINYWLCGFSSVCLYLLLNPFLKLFYGNNHILQEALLDKKIVFCLVIHFYLQGINNTFKTFKNAYGLVRQGWKISLIGSILHVVFCALLGKAYGYIGIYMATIITDICFILIPNIYYLYTNGFKMNFVKEIEKQITRFLLLFIIIEISNIIIQMISDVSLIQFAQKVFLLSVIPNLLLFMVYRKSNSFKTILKRIKEIYYFVLKR